MMVVIRYHGHSCFEIIDEEAPQKNIIFDPFDQNTGSFALETSSWLILCTHDHFDHSAWRRVARRGSIHFVGLVGTKSVDGVEIKGVATFHDPSQGAIRGKNTVYVVKLGGLIIAHLGDLGHLLDEPQLKEILEWGRINILMIPVGGIYTIDSAQAVSVIHQLNPNIAIPMHYRHEKHNQRIFGSISTLEDFLAIARESFDVRLIDSNNVKISVDGLPKKTTIYALKI